MSEFSHLVAKTQQERDETALVKNDASSLKVGERVVWFSDDGPDRGTVEWIGCLPDNPEGPVWAGVAWDNPVGSGNGRYGDEQLFKTKPGHASFIALGCLIKEKDFDCTDFSDYDKEKLESGPSLESHTFKKFEEAAQPLTKKVKNDASSLKVGERVVWFSDDGPDRGTVEWTGCLLDNPEGPVWAGVAWDNPVGKGTGKYKDKEYFHTKEGHASFVALDCLLKEIEFDGTDIKEENSNPSLDNHIHKNLQDVVLLLLKEFFKPSTSLHPFHKVLTEVEYENVQRKTKLEGDIAGAQYLFEKLINKKNWFKILTEILCRRDVKLQHVAAMMKAEEKLCALETQADQNKRTAAANRKSSASIYIENNKAMKTKIFEIFRDCIDPDILFLHTFHKHSENVLTDTDIQNVKAEWKIHGACHASELLLTRLILYEDWYPVLIKVLQNKDFNLSHVADKMEQATTDLRKQ